MDGLNCHFVSRFLTKPWEFGQRQLWYYDFDRKEIEKKSSKTLFAQVGRNTAEIEKRLNELIETPISSAITTLVPSGAIDNVEISEWRLFRALHLLLLLQCSRASEKDTHRSRLGQALSWDERTLDQLVLACQQTDIIVGLRGHPGAPLLLPVPRVLHNTHPTAIRVVLCHICDSLNRILCRCTSASRCEYG